MKSPAPARPLASVSLDLDNRWSYLKTRGAAGWRTFPSYLDAFGPRFLDLMDEAGLKITVFIVGQDAALAPNRRLLAEFVDRGHEPGNHSYGHEPWLHLFPRDRILEEVVETERLIEQATGQKPVGFRGPGFSWSGNLLDVLMERGYLYDSSSLPTHLGPLARLYYFWNASLTSGEKRERRKLYGRLGDGFRPVKPYAWRGASGARLLEMPVTTVPFLKIPFHLSYLIYLSGYSEALMELYLKLALGLCAATRTGPTFLLHPLDFLGSDDVPELAFFPGMGVKKEKKMRVFRKVIRNLRERFEVVKMRAYARELLVRGGLAVQEVPHE
jgi:peptidoglycan/xylan/chitin deacetylase (PgdA/CDA1 family)